MGSAKRESREKLLRNQRFNLLRISGVGSNGALNVNRPIFPAKRVSMSAVRKFALCLSLALFATPTIFAHSSAPDVEAKPHATKSTQKKPTAGPSIDETIAYIQNLIDSSFGRTGYSIGGRFTYTPEDGTITYSVWETNNSGSDRRFVFYSANFGTLVGATWEDFNGFNAHIKCGGRGECVRVLSLRTEGNADDAKSYLDGFRAAPANAQFRYWAHDIFISTNGDMVQGPKLVRAINHLVELSRTTQAQTDKNDPFAK